MDLKILPANIANMIAAGEVVQRPASVVKELMENAVDAGADSITVVIQDAGRTLIQVIDNGKGMSPDEAVLCFERHATSKIASAEDLMSIGTFGFRGEALPSIAAVAEVTLKTRREEDEVGCEVMFADSTQQSLLEVACPRGANFSVRNLFYNIPARRKFIKSENVEMKHIVSEFLRIALTRPDISFTLTQNGRDIYVLRKANSLKFRIQDLLGSNVANAVVDLKADTTVVNVSGYVGRPDSARKSQPNQYFFVNGRFFRSPYLHKAVMNAFEHLLPEGVSPAYFIFLQVPPESMDVNISPTKTEVKFENDSVIFQVLYACVKEALGKNSFGDAIDFDREGAPEIPVLSKKYQETHPVREPGMGIDPTFNPFDNDGFPSDPSPYLNSFGGGNIPTADLGGGFGTAAFPGKEEAPAPFTPSHAVEKRDDYGKLFEEKTMPSAQVLVVKGRYIFLPVKSGVMLVNIRRARERILFEAYQKALAQNGTVTQASLFPVSVQIGVGNMYLFAEHQEMLTQLGFDITPFGTDTIVVNGVPEGYSIEPDKVETMVMDLILALSDDHVSAQDSMLSALAERFARLGASNAARISGAQEAQRLIDDLFACSNTEYTNSGHRIMTLLSEEELDKKFN